MVDDNQNDAIEKYQKLTNYLIGILADQGYTCLNSINSSRVFPVLDFIHSNFTYRHVRITLTDRVWAFLSDFVPKMEQLDADKRAYLRKLADTRGEIPLRVNISITAGSRGEDEGLFFEITVHPVLYQKMVQGLAQWDWTVETSQLSYYTEPSVDFAKKICSFIADEIEEPKASIFESEDILPSTFNEELERIFSDNYLSKEIKDKGKEMADVYLFLYCIENSLRIFIDKAGKEKLGGEYMSKLAIPTSIRRQIEERRVNEKKNVWLGVRGDSDLYYLDFKDLKSLIQNNWEIFQNYFPSQEWITTKIDELVQIRNLIAHNSYIGPHQVEVMRINCRSVLDQIRDGA